MFVFNGKTRNLQTRIYDVSMTSPVGINNWFLPVEYLFPPKHSLKILWKSEHFPRKYKKNVNGCFFLNTVYNSNAKLSVALKEMPRFVSVFSVGLQWLGSAIPKVHYSH